MIISLWGGFLSGAYVQGAFVLFPIYYYNELQNWSLYEGMIFVFVIVTVNSWDKYRLLLIYFVRMEFSEKYHIEGEAGEEKDSSIKTYQWQYVHQRFDTVTSI